MAESAADETALDFPWLLSEFEMLDDPYEVGVNDDSIWNLRHVVFGEPPSECACPPKRLNRILIGRGPIKL